MMQLHDAILICNTLLLALLYLLSVVFVFTTYVLVCRWIPSLTCIAQLLVPVKHCNLKAQRQNKYKSGCLVKPEYRRVSVCVAPVQRCLMYLQHTDQMQRHLIEMCVHLSNCVNK